MNDFFVTLFRAVVTAAADFSVRSVPRETNGLCFDLVINVKKLNFK